MERDGGFSFTKQAATFDKHITQSIRGYSALRSDCRRLSQYFIQPNTKVVDIGCSTGEFLRSVRDHNEPRVKKVKYVGVDINSDMAKRWKEQKGKDLTFRKADVTKSSDLLDNTSVVFSMFTLQFLPETERVPLVKRIYDGLAEGGALILSEKVHAKNAKIQDMLTFLHYDFKNLNFSEADILKKERGLRDMMKPWTEYKIFEMLRSVGFTSSNLQLFWRNHLFVGILAYKPAKFRSEKLTGSPKTATSFDVIS